MKYKVAIKPHKNRGNEIIKIFENRGFRNPSKYGELHPPKGRVLPDSMTSLA